MRLTFLLVILLASIATAAYTPEELVKPREIAFDCKAGVCTLSQADMEFLTEQNHLLGKISLRLYEKLMACNGGRAT